MKAIIYENYGSPDELRLADIDKPTPAEDQILIKIHAVSINGSDHESLRGRPLYARIGGLRKPGHPILGSDIAGTVESVGRNHTEFKVGDAVYGEIPNYNGGFAEYVCTDGRTMAHKPEGLTFEEAAALPQAGSIAFRGVHSVGQLKAGESMLINGAGGSGGSFAIQLAKRVGATVTGVDHTHKLDYMRALGADQVIDYTQENFSRNGTQYDLILDMIGKRAPFSLTRSLKPGGRYYCVGGRVDLLIRMLLLSPLIKQLTGKRVGMLLVPQNRGDLAAITKRVLDGSITPSIDRRFPLEQVPDAFRYIEEGKSKGKLVIAVTDQSDRR